MELLDLLTQGGTEVLQFRKSVTTTHNELTSDDISDTRFDDGKKLKGEVLELLSYLATMDPRARETEGLFCNSDCYCRLSSEPEPGPIIAR